MKGLELAEKFYNEYGKPMIEDEFSEYADRIAVGLVGHGSECFGYDDEISLDHDFSPAFNVWITDEDDAVFGFKLFRAVSKLPKEFSKDNHIVTNQKYDHSLYQALMKSTYHKSNISSQSCHKLMKPPYHTMPRIPVARR